MQMYGRKITAGLRKGTPSHLYLPGPRRGVWNVEALEASREIILCESLIDALTFWCSGLRHVTTAYGTNGLTDDHWEAFRRHGTERVLIAFDRDDAGERAAEDVAKKLTAAGIEAFRTHFPKGMDANEYASKVQPAAKSLEVVVRNATWLGKGKDEAPVIEAATTRKEEAAKKESSTANETPTTDAELREPCGNAAWVRGKKVPGKGRVKFPGKNPAKAPQGFEWRGKPGSKSGSNGGNWYNPKTGESLHPDLNHPGPIGPHWDYRNPSGNWFRIFPDGRQVPK